MASLDTAAALSRPQAKGRTPALFAATLFLSALLLFAVQPRQHHLGEHRLHGKQQQRAEKHRSGVGGENQAR